MTTLIAAYDSDGCIGRCDARCHEAKNPECKCICGGANHGVGGLKALDNTRNMVYDTFNTWITEEGLNPDDITITINENIVKQLTLPLFTDREYPKTIENFKPCK